MTNGVITAAGVRLRVLRLDLIHPVVSGNKLFKLKYYFENATAKKQTVISFGGAHSNHLVAVAYYAQQHHIKCRGIVRGEKPPQLSASLKDCVLYGMQLEFVSRELYAQLSKQDLSSDKLLQIPEGGFGALGVQGAAEIMDINGMQDATHIALSVGSATTLAGTIKNNKYDAEIIAVPAIKNMDDLPQRLDELLGEMSYQMPTIFKTYHFGGFAKISPTLIDFMNNFYRQQNIPLDRIYTAKLLYGIVDKIGAGYFSKGSNIVAIHTGGLQGNRSLGKGTLIF